jgi:glucose/arabinose dehydrogenase
MAAAGLLVIAALSSCDRDGGEPVADPPVVTPTAPSASGPRDGDRDGRTPTGAGAFDSSAVELEVNVVVRGLDAPLGVTHAGDGSGRLFVIEQGGTVRIVSGGEVLPEPFLDVSDLVVAGGEQGLLGLAFHPGYEDNGRFFVNYTDTNGDTVVAEYAVSQDAGAADPGSERVLLRIDQPFPNHNGGHLVFGPDGYLYIGTGDGGGAGDPEGNGQDTSTLLGKLLRIDVDARAGDRYGIPPGNPFAGDAEGRPEIWAYGLRNPWRFSFDPSSGDLWIADVGQSAFEEINRRGAGAAGLNYGWDVMEGRNCYEEEGCDRSGKVMPLSSYSHEHGCSVTGGLVYRGTAAPELRGGYVFGDYCSGNIWVLDSRAEGFVEPVQVLSDQGSISSFGEDEERELYMTDLAAGELLGLTTR